MCIRVALVIAVCVNPCERLIFTRRGADLAPMPSSILHKTLPILPKPITRHLLPHSVVAVSFKAMEIAPSAVGMAFKTVSSSRIK